MPKLYPEDQAKVNQYLKEQGEERPEFKPGILLIIVLAVLALLTLASYLIAAQHGSI